MLWDIFFIYKNGNKNCSSFQYLSLPHDLTILRRCSAQVSSSSYIINTWVITLFSLQLPNNKFIQWFWDLRDILPRLVFISNYNSKLPYFLNNGHVTMKSQTLLNNKLVYCFYLLTTIFQKQSLICQMLLFNSKTKSWDLVK